MTQIAVYIQNDIVTDVATEKSAQKYTSKPGWILVESDPTFLIDQRFAWTVRASDNKLVHISTGMTPDEETTQADALLGKNVGVAIATANTADQKADNAIAGLALLGKQVAAQNTTDGGTK